VPAWVPYGNVFSAGDVLIAAGGFVFALAATGALDRLRLRARLGGWRRWTTSTS
jgi:hypothetical protein